MDKPPIVTVFWRDAKSETEWEPIDKHKTSEPSNIESTGYLLANDDKKIVLCLNLDWDGKDASDVIVIPKSWEERIEVHP